MSHSHLYIKNNELVLSFNHFVVELLCIQNNKAKVPNGSL